MSENNDTEEVRYAGFWIRVLAGILDSMVLFIGFFILEAVTNIPFFKAVSLMNGVSVEPVDPMLLLIVAGSWFFYFVFFLASKMQATPGKWLLNIYVTTSGGGRLSFIRSFFREIMSWISGIIVLGYIMVGLNRRKKGLHDFVAGTLSMRGSPNN